MPFFRLDPHDEQRIRVAADILEAARVMDDPRSYPVLAELLSNDIAHGWDLEPDDYLLYLPEGAARRSGCFSSDSPDGTTCTSRPSTWLCTRRSATMIKLLSITVRR